MENIQDSQKMDTNGKKKKPPRSEKKRRNYDELIKQKRENRKQKKIERRKRLREEKTDCVVDDQKSKKELKEEIREKCRAAMVTGQKICIDCSLGKHMSKKEKGKLAMQIGRLYGCNKRADNPAHIYLTGLNKGGFLYQECIKKNDGFTNFIIDNEEKSHTELFPLDRIVYLSPDSDNLLSDIDPDKVYVIGGLVDESITKNITTSKCSASGVTTARLPIVEYMDKLDEQPTSTVLAVNQVFDILLSYTATKCWKTALSVGVPRRKGYVVKEKEDAEKTS